MENHVSNYDFLLLVITPESVQEYSLKSFGRQCIYLGRDSGKNQICLNYGMVSHRHGRFTISENQIHYEDLGSNNGTYVDVFSNQSCLKNSSRKIELRDGMVLNIGGTKQESSIYILFSICAGKEAWKRISISQKKLTIGRAADNDIVLSHPAVSRHHIHIKPFADGYAVIDESRKNGTFINGRIVREHTVLKECDFIQIMTYQMFYMKGFLFYKTVSRGIGLSVSHLGKKISGRSGKTLLHDVSCHIDSNEFVAIIGGSGAGKTTLMNALSGFDQKTTGNIYLNGLDLRQNFKFLKAIIGYVPQEDIIYENLTLKKMLEYTSKLRVRDDMAEAEGKKQIQTVLEMVDLKDHEDTLIKKLSGGQKKRASIAVELLADPKLFFLDEPTSGLDPGTEQSLMRTLNRLSKTQEKTIIMVTHNIQNLDLCDRIIFMGKDGRLCFSGSLKEARMFFDTDNLADAYDMVSDNSAVWEAQFAKFHNATEESLQDKEKRHMGIKNNKNISSMTRQWLILVSRYMELIKNDWIRLAVLLLQPMVIGFLLYLVSDEMVFEVYENTKTMMFALCCSAIWMGLFNSIQEICKERNILKREYMGNLKLSAYMLSKFFVQALVGLVQVLLLAGIFLLAIGKNIKGIYCDSFVPEICMTLWLVIVASEAMGFLVSANVRSGDKAMVAAPFLLIIQLLFSGILFKLTGAGKLISSLTISRWAVEILGSIVGLNELPLKIQGDYPMIEHTAESLFEATGKHVKDSMCVLVVMIVVFLIVSGFCLKRLSGESR